MLSSGTVHSRQTELNWTAPSWPRYTHPFSGPLSGTTRVSQYQKDKTNLDFTEARDSEWQWHQLGQMLQVCTSLQTDNHASTPPLRFLQARCPSCRPTNSVKALKANIKINEKIKEQQIKYSMYCYCIRPHHWCTQPVATDVAWFVCLSVHLLVTTISCAKKGWSDRYAIWGEDFGGPKEPLIDGAPIPQEKRQFGGRLLAHCRI